jgi:DNA-binding CsgD family transcriptional regulator
VVPVPDLPPQPLLRPLERELLRLVASGCTQRAAAEKLSYSYPYVREVLAGAADHLGVNTVIAAVYVAAKRGLI